MKMIKVLKKCQKGAAMVEYGLLVALIAVIAIAGVTVVGTSVDSNFDEVAACLGDTTAGGTCPGA